MAKPPRITVVICPKCQCDVFTLTRDREWRCIKSKQLVKGPKNFQVVQKKGNPYSVPRSPISLVGVATCEAVSAKPVQCDPAVPSDR
jgi:hypothetical protein